MGRLVRFNDRSGAAQPHPRRYSPVQPRWSNEEQAFATSARNAGAVTTTWWTAIIVQWNATDRSSSPASSPGPARRSRPVLRQAKQDRRRVRVRKGRQGDASCAPRRNSPDGVVVKPFWKARRPSSSWCSAAAQRGCSASWQLRAEARSHSSSMRTASSHDCSARSTSSGSTLQKYPRRARKWSPKASGECWPIAPGMSASRSR